MFYKTFPCVLQNISLCFTKHFLVFYKTFPCVLQNICLKYILVFRHPTAFEYSEELLVFLHRNSTASRYGDFLGNSEQERAALHVPRDTVAIWDGVFLEGDSTRFTNPAYRPHSGPLRPRVTEPQSVRSWASLFLKNHELDSLRGLVAERRAELHRSFKLLDRRLQDH